MIDYDTILSLPKQEKITYLLLTVALIISVLGYLHQLINFNRFKRVSTDRDLDVFAWFVRTQMTCSLLMLGFLIPGILISVFNGAECFVIGLAVYAFIYVNGRVFSRVEDSFKRIRSESPELDAQIQEMIQQWDKKIFPTF